MECIDTEFVKEFLEIFDSCTLMQLNFHQSIPFSAFDFEFHLNFTGIELE
jgi:hypothetical protein